MPTNCGAWYTTSSRFDTYSHLYFLKVTCVISNRRWLKPCWLLLLDLTVERFRHIDDLDETAGLHDISWPGHPRTLAPGIGGYTPSLGHSSWLTLRSVKPADNGGVA